ncbi:MAG: hypothetical protein Fur005_38350 [Roseiflexaceae bacterium]
MVGGLISIVLFERVIGSNQGTERPAYQPPTAQAAKQPHGL